MQTLCHFQSQTVQPPTVRIRTETALNRPACKNCQRISIQFLADERVTEWHSFCIEWISSGLSTIKVRGFTVTRLGDSTSF